MTAAIQINVREHAGAPRTQEVVCVGVPLPRGHSAGVDRWAVQCPQGQMLPSQTEVLANWSDGSVKWLQVIFPATVSAHANAGYLLLAANGKVPDINNVVNIETLPDHVVVSTGEHTFKLPRSGDVLLADVRKPDDESPLGASVQITVTNRQLRRHPFTLKSLQLLETGPQRARISFTGKVGRTGLTFFGHWTFVAYSSVASLEITLRNPMRARHLQGCWDLGDSGSVLFRECAVSVKVDDSAPAEIQWRPDPASPWHRQSGETLEIYQDSSGGDNYNSRNHLNRLGQVPIRTRGYSVKSQQGESYGLRSQPTCVLHQGERWIAVTIPEFWQQFPKALSANESAITIGLFPAQSGDLHELQGGEQKTHRIGLQFGSSHELKQVSLESVASPLEALCDIRWTAATGVVDNLPRQSSRLRPEWFELARDSLEGSNSFFAKREIVDEYGWRHYGDLWADHEEEHYQGRKPLCSHYNNQYDALQGFLLCYLCSGDHRWWQLADTLARHIIDIDIYHTQYDRAAYNGGLFWHTNHYRAAETSSHRSYSKVNHPGGGGGPSNEHNYSSGLLLYYFLTGNRQARDTVVGLADWVLNMDNGRRHILGLVHDGPTGFASFTADLSYHGPGRGVGNSINTLLDGWLASKRDEFLRKVESLISRTVHPQDDISARNLDNAELRWSYTVMLQALARCIAFGEECGLSTEIIEYSEACLLHYASWMAQKEVFYLDRPQDLEFPTETWAAQELRKANVLFAASKYGGESELSRLMTKRAVEFNDRAWLSLMSFPTRSCTRPVVLAIQLGLVSASLADFCPSQGSKSPKAPHNGEIPMSSFVPQKEAVRRALRSPITLAAMLLKMGRFWRWSEPLRATWTAQRLRRLFWIK